MLLSFKIHQKIHQGIHQITFEIGSKQLFFINKFDGSFGTDTETHIFRQIAARINMAIGRYIL